MSMSSSYSRPFGAPSYPESPSAATASSVNYSQYGGSAFSPSRQPQPQPLSGFGQSSGRMNGASGSGSRPGGKSSAGKTAESREIARVHFKALKGFLTQWLDKETPTSRASAREKLTRLTKLQFQELSTDVYDELMRRIAADKGENDGDVPFLPVRDDFHPKRNQARQKLATLPRNRFKDLASDVFFELNRRFPEFEEEDDGEEAFADPPPAPGPRHPFAAPGNASHLYPDSADRSRTNATPPPMARLNSASSSHRRQASRNISGGSSVGSSGIPGHRPRPSREESNGPRGGQPNPTATTSDMVVPNKSRMREEEIEVPYARDSLIMDEPRAQSRSSNRPGSRSSYQDEGRTPLGMRQDSGDVMSPASADDREYYDRMSFSSNVTNKSKLPTATGMGGWNDEREQKIRSEYELKIAGLERRIQAGERDRDEARRQEAFEAERRREMEDELRGLKERATTHASSLRSLQHELDIARDATEAARSHGEQSSRGAEEEVEHWRHRCEGLEDELRHLEQDKADGNRGSSSGHDGALPELKAEIHSLVDELNSLSMKNDELMAQREQDAEGMDEMEAKVQEYKKKYDSIRIELRNLKATSTMFISKPLSDDHLPASADGNIEDVHVSAFQTAIDGLLTAARSSAPSGVLPAMKAVVEAVTEVGEDVKAFESHPNIDVDVSRLESLKHESTTRLNTLMQAARNHAMASGLSPVSLLDAAAGHLTSNVIEIIKLLKIKRSDKNRELRRSRSSLSIKDMVNRSNSQSAAPPPRDVGKANGDWDREYGTSSRNGNNQGEERLRESPVVIHRPTDDRPTPAPINTQLPPQYPIATPTELTPASASQYLARTSSQTSDNQRQQPLRINSYQSASSQKSDSFDLERKASVSSNVADQRPMVERSGSLGPSAYDYANANGNTNSNGARGPMSPVHEPLSPLGMPYEKDDSGDFGYNGSSQPQEANDGADEREWEDLKPYLNTQSSALVNSIQNLLAAIRTSSAPSVLNEHLSEVVAIASSIVAVSSNALPASLRVEGDRLLQELIRDTDRLSEAQGTGVNTGEKGVRQQIASASFGVAKSLKALMKLGSD